MTSLVHLDGVERLPHLCRRKGEGLSAWMWRLDAAKATLRSLHKSAAWREYLGRLDEAERIANNAETSFKDGQGG